jgi:hypothetical protein
MQFRVAISDWRWTASTDRVSVERRLSSYPRVRKQTASTDPVSVERRLRSIRE